MLTTVSAQQVVISGTVTDESGIPLPGVTVLIKGSQASTVSDANGNYRLSPLKDLDQTDVLEFRYLGFKTKTITYAGNNILDVKLVEDVQSLKEVVVTALGIRREEKALGYSVTKLDGDQLTDATSNNWADALKGKVAGLNLTQAGSGPINSTRINLRGDRSLDPTKNEALIVVDGVPIVNGRVSSGVNDAYGAGVTGDRDIPIDFGNGLSDINPDDIESVTVLKGAAATALYGSRAGNGALIITTKSGNKRERGVGITVNSNTSINDVLRWPDFQHEYGQGNNNRNKQGELYYSYGLTEDGPNTGSTSSAWGPKFEGQMYYQYDPTVNGRSLERQPWVPYRDNVKGFWQTGRTFMNSVALDGGTDQFNARASFTHTTNEWIMPNTGFERMVASLNTGLQLSKQLKLNGKLSYTNKKSDNLPGTGYNNQSISYFMIFQNPNVDLNWYSPRWQPGQEQIKQIHPFSSYIENPFLIAHEMTNSLKSNTFDGSLQGTYTFSPKFDLMIRSGLNMRQDQRDSKRPWDTSNFPQGYYKQQDVSFFESNSDALLTYNDKISPVFDIRASIGGNLMTSEVKANNAIARGLVLPGVYKLSNSLVTPIANNDLLQRKMHSVFGLLNLSWDDKVFVDITGRNDWSSTLPSGNNSYFYPSVSTSYILTDIFPLPAIVSFAKLRLSWAQVGTDTSPYQTLKYYGTSSFPGSAQAPTTLHNANLKPEISRSWETGLNFLLFKSRVNADVNLYSNTTNNQVLRVPLDVTTGFSYAYINGGKIRNRGIEVMLSVKPIVTPAFKWTSTLTWAKNDNRILELSKDIPGYQQIVASSGTAQIVATQGGTTGDIWGYALVRNPQGQVIYNAATGFPARPTDIQKIGSAYADWRGGVQNEFSFKNFTVSALVDGQYGGIVYSQTHHKMTEQGKLKHTLMGRGSATIVGDGVVLNADGTYSPNTKEVPLQRWYGDYYRRANVETNSLDASYLKLREARIEYRLPKSLTGKMRVSGASIALYGRDLAMISKFPIFDPETAALNGSTIMPGVEMGQLPTPRTWGLNLRLQF